jgi:hypothetical protein
MTENTEPQRYRMPLARVVELLLTKPAHDPAEKVEITRNAKGDYQYKVEAASRNGETLEECAVRAQEVADKLNTAYGLSRAQLYERQTTPLDKS